MEKFSLMAVLAAFLSSSVVFACPNLEGSFRCIEEGEKKEFSVSQYQDAENVWHFTVTENETVWPELVADGQERSYEVNESLQNASYSAVCENSQAVMKVVGDVVDNGSPVGTLNLDVLIYLDSAQNLGIRRSGMLNGDWGSIPVDETVTTCERIGKQK